MISTSTVAEILRMDVAERLALVESIWDSITLFPDLVTPTDAQIAELDKRFRSYQKNPNAGTSWDKVVKKIQSRQE